MFGISDLTLLPGSALSLLTNSHGFFTLTFAFVYNCSISSGFILQEFQSKEFVQSGQDEGVLISYRDEN